MSNFRCDKEAAVVNLLLTTLDDGGRSQALLTLTVDWRLLLVDHTQRPALCATQWATERDAARRAGPLASGVRLVSQSISQTSTSIYIIEVLST